MLIETKRIRHINESILVTITHVKENRKTVGKKGKKKFGVDTMTMLGILITLYNEEMLGILITLYNEKNEDYTLSETSMIPLRSVKISGHV